jgi:hypothetical protein
MLSHACITLILNDLLDASACVLETIRVSRPGTMLLKLMPIFPNETHQRRNRRTPSSKATLFLSSFRLELFPYLFGPPFDPDLPIDI